MYELAAHRRVSLRDAQRRHATQRIAETNTREWMSQRKSYQHTSKILDELISRTTDLLSCESRYELSSFVFILGQIARENPRALKAHRDLLIGYLQDDKNLCECADAITQMDRATAEQAEQVHQAMAEKSLLPSAAIN